jgi:branched-chain amino acid transport system substrate-binding protein
MKGNVKWTRREFMKMSGALTTGLLVGNQMIPTLGYAQQEGPIKAFATVPLTRELTFFGKAISDAVTDYITLVNEEGGVKGRKLEAEIADDKNLVDAGVANFRRVMTKDPKPIMLFSGNTGITKAITRIIEQEFSGQIVYMGLSQSTELWAPKEHPYYFVMGPTYSDEARACLRYLKELGGKKVVIVRNDIAWGLDPMPAIKEIAPKLGMEIMEEVVAKIGSMDLTSQVLRVKALKPDGVYIHGYLYDTPALLVKTMASHGFSAKKTPIIMSSWSTNKEFVTAAGEASEGVYGVSHTHFWEEQDKPGIKKIIDFNKKHHPDVKYRSDIYIRGWLCAIAGIEGLKRADKINGEALKKAIETIVDFDTGGLSPKLNLKDHKLMDYTTVYQVRSGNLTPLKEVYGGADQK